jgi:tRNA 2-thiouridine synthesizing protein A
MLSIKKVGEKSYGLDLRRFVCPYPQMYTSQALAKPPMGSIFKVIINNPPSIKNIKSVAQNPVPSLSLQIQEAASGIL